MPVRRFYSTFFKNFAKPQLPSSAKPVDEVSGKSLARKAVSFVLITVTGGVALSALDDLAIYYSCSRKALEKASNHQEIKGALGEPIIRGPWYNASLAVAHKRQSASCTFPVSGPGGTGVLQLKAIRSGGGENSWLSVWRPLDWDIIVMDALLHVPGNDERNQTLRINVSDYLSPPDNTNNNTPCTDSKRQDSK